MYVYSADASWAGDQVVVNELMQASFASVNLDGAGLAAHPTTARLPDSSPDSSGVSSDEESLAGHGTPAKVAHTEVRRLVRPA